MPAIQLRPAGEADIPFLCQVYGSTRTEELKLTHWSEAEKQAFIVMQFNAQRQYYAEHYSGAEYLIIEADEKPAGRLYLMRWPDDLRIMDIALLPEFRGQGIGTVLLQQILAEGHARGIPVSIHVERFNPALNLYERLGFQRVEDKGVYFFLKFPPATAEEV